MARNRNPGRRETVADIVHEFTVKAQPERVFQLFATPEGMEKWWTKASGGETREGGEVRLYFGRDFKWRGRVTRSNPPHGFELEITEAHPDWLGTRVGCELIAEGAEGAPLTRVRFYHSGWPEANAHWRVSNFCWAMYLRILRRNAEFGEEVEYEKRLEV
jgi:uncharacterized protein YndB with AHSA1/START domain